MCNTMSNTMCNTGLPSGCFDDPITHNGIVISNLRLITHTGIVMSDKALNIVQYYSNANSIRKINNELIYYIYFSYLASIEIIYVFLFY